MLIMYNGAVCGAEHGRHKYKAIMWLSAWSLLWPASICVRLHMHGSGLFLSLMCVSVSMFMSTPGPATARHPALHLSGEMPHRESPSRAITHHAWPFLNNFINIPWASLNRRVGKVMAWRVNDADSIKPPVPAETWGDN